MMTEFDPVEFVVKCRLVYAKSKHDPKLVYSNETLVAELRAALGAARADDGLPVTEEWLRSVGFTTAPNSAYVRAATKDNAVAVRLATGEVEIYDNESLEMCRVHGVNRGRMRSLCSGIGIPLTESPTP